jgi:regulator of sigma D
MVQVITLDKHCHRIADILSQGHGQINSNEMNKYVDFVRNRLLP